MPDFITAATGIGALMGGLGGLFGKKDSAPRQIPPSEEELALIRAQTALIDPQAAYLQRMLPAQEIADRYKLFLDTGDMTILNTGRTQDGSMSTPGATEEPADTGMGTAGEANRGEEGSGWVKRGIPVDAPTSGILNGRGRRPDGITWDFERFPGGPDAPRAGTGTVTGAKTAATSGQNFTRRQIEGTLRRMPVGSTTQDAIALLRGGDPSTSVPVKASQQPGAAGMQSQPWAQKLAGAGGLMGLQAREEMAQREAETGLIPQRAGLESLGIGEEMKMVPQRYGLEGAQIGAERELIPLRTGLESSQITSRKGLTEGLPGRGAYADLGTQYGSGIEMQEAMSRTGQFLQERGLLRSGVMPELASRRTAEIAERSEGKRRAELERGRALGLGG